MDRTGINVCTDPGKTLWILYKRRESGLCNIYSFTPGGRQNVDIALEISYNIYNLRRTGSAFSAIIVRKRGRDQKQ